MTSPIPVDVAELEKQVRYLYRSVAEDPTLPFHFPLGRPLAEHLGYPTEKLDDIPSEAVDSFVGVGYFFDLAGLEPGEKVLDLGSGSGTDTFFAANEVGRTGHVDGIDMTSEQVAKAKRLRDGAGLSQVSITDGRIENLPFPGEHFDAVISNGVINIIPDKVAAFNGASRVLRHGGRLVISDIVTEALIPAEMVGNVELWATCVGGAAHVPAYHRTIEEAGFRIEAIRDNEYEFGTGQARDAGKRYGIKSTTILGRKI